MEEFPFFEQQLLNTYYLVRIIGKGAVGTVYECIDVRDGKKYALKAIYVGGGRTGKRIQDAFVSELTANRWLSKEPKCNKYVVCYHDAGVYTPSSEITDDMRRRLEELGLESRAVYSRQVYYMVQSLMDGDLRHLTKILDRTEVLPLALFWIMERTISGLAYIHEKGLAHQDIKPENILYQVLASVTTEGELPTVEECLFDPLCTLLNLRINYGDLGFACADAIQHIRECTAEGSEFYFSPEMIREEELDLELAQSSDIWALGVTLWEFVFGRHPFFEPDIGRRQLYTFLQTVTEEEIESLPVYRSEEERMREGIRFIFKNMLRVNPRDRMSMSALKKVIDENYVLPSLQDLPDILVEL